MNKILELKYNKLLREGKTEVKAMQIVIEIDNKRKEKLKLSQTEESKNALAKLGQAANKGAKRSSETKKLMRESNLKYREENADQIKVQNEKKKITFANKTEEEKRLTNEKRSASIKAWWAANKDSDIIKSRNKKLSQINKDNNSMHKPGAREKSSLSHLGKKQSNETLVKRAKTREGKAARGESLGLKSKFYKVGDYMCQGSSEKKYIEDLYSTGVELPIGRGSFVETPYGVYHPDFEFKDRFVEIKSEYTYKIYNGELPNIDGVRSIDQKNKLEWTSNNYKRVEIVVI